MVVIRKNGKEKAIAVCDKDQEVVFLAKTTKGYLVITAPANSTLSDLGKSGLIVYVFETELIEEIPITEGAYDQRNHVYFLRHEKKSDEDKIPEFFFSFRKNVGINDKNYSCPKANIIEVYYDNIIDPE